MSKKIRDFLFVLFIILFIFITVITSLYASGYKFNLTWPLKFNRLLQKTGMLIVATKPSRATIYLDDKPKQDLSFNPWKKDYLTTPSKVKNILPGRYELSLELDGYWPYRQTINIYSGETTFVENVVLFKESSPRLVLASPETNLLLSRDNKYIYTQASNEIINLKTEETRSLINKNDTAKNDLKIIAANLTVFPPGKWLSNNKFFKDGIIYDPLKETGDINSANIIGANATNWYFEESNDLLYYQNNQTINQFALNSKTNSLLLSDVSYLAYKPLADKIFTITQDSQIKLRSYSLNNQALKEEWSLPNNGDYIFTENLLGYLSVYDNRNQALYLFRPDYLAQGPIAINNISNWVFLGNKTLLYANDFEIYIFDLENERSELITRRSDKIINLIWNKSDNYLIFTGGNSLNIFDFKNKNTTTLINAEKITSPVFDEKNKNIYFWARINEEEGIYKMNLQ